MSVIDSSYVVDSVASDESCIEEEIQWQIARSPQFTRYDYCARAVRRSRLIGSRLQRGVHGLVLHALETGTTVPRRLVRRVAPIAIWRIGRAVASRLNASAGDRMCRWTALGADLRL